MFGEVRTVSQVIDIIKNLKKVSTNSEVAQLLNINPRTLAAGAKKGEISRRLTVRLIAFAQKEHISINYVFINIESLIKESQILRISCGPVKVDKEGRVQERLAQSDTWELCYVFKGKLES